MKSSVVPVTIALTLMLAAAYGQSAASLPPYHIAKTVPIGAPDRWDYLVYDLPSHRLYISHGDRLTVLDGQNGAVLGAVEGMPGGTHGIGIVAAVGKGYTDDGKAGEAVAFDLKTLKTGNRIKAEDDADGVAFDPASGHIFVVDGDTGPMLHSRASDDFRGQAMSDAASSFTYWPCWYGCGYSNNIAANRATITVV